MKVAVGTALLVAAYLAPKAWAGPASPLCDLGSGTYLGFTGGLYPGGSNEIPPGHLAAGLTRAATIRPLDRSGNPDSSGKIVLLSVGMSNKLRIISDGRF